MNRIHILYILYRIWTNRYYNDEIENWCLVGNYTYIVITYKCLNKGTFAVV